MSARLTPQDVAERYGCGRRKAFKIMREAGAFRFGTNSLRCSEEDLERWELAQVAVAGSSQEPPDLFTRPQKRGVFSHVPTCSGVYVVRCGDRVKIGRARNVRKRVASLQGSSSEPLEFLGLLSLEPDEEASFHRRFYADHERGEWFRLTKPIVEALLPKGHA